MWRQPPLRQAQGKLWLSGRVEDPAAVCGGFSVSGKTIEASLDWTAGGGCHHIF